MSAICDAPDCSRSVTRELIAVRPLSVSFDGAEQRRALRLRRINLVCVAHGIAPLRRRTHVDITKFHTNLVLTYLRIHFMLMLFALLPHVPRRGRC